MKRVLVAAAAAALLAPAWHLGTAGAAAPPIPALPTDMLSGGFHGTAARPRPITPPHTAQNPFLSPDGTNTMHDDAYATDAYRVSGPLGRNLQVRSASYGVSECATVAFDSRHHLVGLCGGLEGFAMRLIDPTTLDQIASLTTSRREVGLSNPFTDLCGGTYFYLDHHDQAYLLTTKKQIWRVQVGARTLTHDRTYDLAAAVPGKDCVIATLPDWKGRIFFATQQGRVGVVDPRTGAVHTLRFAGQGIVNSMAGDESGAIYVVTTHRLAAVAADRNGVPHVRWSVPYDRGSEQKPGQLSQGSGTTPTLVGRDVVAITDNADPRMHVSFYDRRPGVRHRLLCSAPVFAPGRSDTENSLAVSGRSVIVENNYGYTGVQATTLGRTTTAGIAKVVLRTHRAADGEITHRCPVVWTSTVTAPTSVPKVSWGNGLLYVYAKPASNPLDDSWYLTAIDTHTGHTVWQQRTGNGIQWNNHYAAIYLGPDGTAYIATLAGLIRFADGS